MSKMPSLDLRGLLPRHPPLPGSVAGIEGTAELARPSALAISKSRRNFFGSAAGVCLLLALPGCGFAPRKAPVFNFHTVYSGLSEASPLGVELRRTLQSTGKLRVLTDISQLPQADVVLEVLKDQREKVVISTSAAGQVREFQLRLRFAFRLRSQSGAELIAETELVQQRDISFSESAALAKEAEESLLYRDMQSDVVQQIVRRLAAVGPLQ